MNKFHLLILAPLILVFASCNEERKDGVISDSPDGTIRITVSGKRDSPVSPWITNMVARGNGLNGNIAFEFYGNDISDKTIGLIWEGNEKCTATFLEKDGTKRIFEFTPRGNEVIWKDLSPR